MIQRMFVTLDTKKTNYKNVGKINHGDDLILELTVLSDGDMISFNDPMVDLLVKKSDGKMIRQNSGIEHIKPNKFVIEVSKDCVTSPGLSTNQLIINDNGRISTCMFYYTILNSLEEDIIQSISNVEVLEQLDEFTIQMKDKMENFDEEFQNRISELEDAIDDLEEFFGDTGVDLLEAEFRRNEAEQSRAKAESVRVQNENRRLQNDLDLANAEAERVRAENIRIQNEVDRALVDAVMDQKESKREDSELERIQNESKRATDEVARQQNENTRQSNESIRMSNETDRKTQENRRVTAETTRVNAETTRRNNENSRISNETERQKAMNEMKSLIGIIEDEIEEINSSLDTKVSYFDERVGIIDDEIEEINSSLDTKVSYFENINDIKISNKIKVNSICKTLGYYNANDGGGATYRITNNAPLNNGFSFSLNNGLTAELIYNDEINIKQLGARSFDENGNKVDIKPYIKAYISKSSAHENNGENKQMLKLFIPTGRWFTSPHKIVASSFYIYGVNQYSYPYATGTIIAPISDNQEYIWLVGDDTTDLSGREYGNITLKSLMFTTYNFASNTGIPWGGQTAAACYSVEKMLGVHRVYGGHFENLYFTNYLGTALSISSSNESVFDDITLRNGDAMFKGNIVFDTDVVGNKNISACFIDRISFEGVKGDLFVFKESSKYINNHIGTVLFEDRACVISKDGDVRNYVVADDENKEFSPMAVFRIEEQEQCELVVDNVLLNNFGRAIYTYDSNEYLFDTIVLEQGKVSKGLANIKTITNYGTRRDTMLYNKAPYEGLGSHNFTFTCENAKHTDTDLYKFIIKSSGMTKPYIRYKDIGYKRCIDYVSYPNILLNKNGKVGYYMPVISDEESITDEKLVINNLQYKNYLTSYSEEASCFIIPVVGNKLHIRVKTKIGFLAQCFASDNPSEYQNKTIRTTEEVYTWHTIDFTEYRATQTDKELKIAIRTLTSDETNYVKLDVFYWE